MPGKKYDMRKKLYEMTDIALKFSIDLRTNQADFDYDLLGTGEPVYLREMSTNKSDYVPFDAKGLPIVFFESYEFFETSIDQLTESRNPVFASTAGKIRGTVADDSATLAAALEATRLQTRINEVAFLLVQAAKTGSDLGVAAITPAAVTPSVVTPTVVTPTVTVPAAS